eukprot:4752411-Prymnesium_polylepis.1
MPSNRGERVLLVSSRASWGRVGSAAPRRGFLLGEAARSFERRRRQQAAAEVIRVFDVERLRGRDTGAAWWCKGASTAAAQARARSAAARGAPPSVAALSSVKLARAIEVVRNFSRRPRVARRRVTNQSSKGTFLGTRVCRTGTTGRSSRLLLSV